MIERSIGKGFMGLALIFKTVPGDQIVIGIQIEKNNSLIRRLRSLVPNHPKAPDKAEKASLAEMQDLYAPK